MPEKDDVSLNDERFSRYYPVVQQERRLIAGSVVSKFIEKWDRKGKVLIPGYGRGGTMMDLWMSGFDNYYGLDLNLAALKSSRLENRLVQANISKMPFPENSFDYAAITDVFQDFGNFDDLVDGLKSIAKTMKKGGQILLTNPTSESYKVETKLFDCSKFPENIKAVEFGMGREAKGRMKTVGRNGERLEFDFTDHVWRDEDLEEAFELAGLKKIFKERPLARDDTNLPNYLGVHDWISETKVPSWVVYLLEVSK